MDKDDTISCEETHVANDKLSIVSIVHKSNSSDYGFPENITIEIKNHSGCLAEYKMVREGSIEDFILT
jgi:hypothetical protein